MFIPANTAPRPTTPTRFHVGDPFAGTRVPTPGAPGSPLEFTYDKVTSRFALQREFRDGVMGYISYSEGFNSGGVAAPTIQGVRTELPYKPQTIETFELGLRSDLADGRVRFNATLFDTAWNDFQSAGVVYDSQGRQVPQLQTTNVGDAAAQGVEFEFTWLPIESLMVNLGLGLLDTEYTELPPGQTSGHLALDERHRVRTGSGHFVHDRLGAHRQLHERRLAPDARGLQLPVPVLALRAVPAHGRLSVHSGRHL